MTVDLKNIFGRLSGAFNKRSLKFATEVEHEALKLIRGKVSPYDAVSRARQLMSARCHPGGEQPAFRDFTLIQKMLSNYDPSIVDRHISPNETMTGDNYFWVGTSAIEVVVTACMVSQLTEVNRVLDLPCGHGRVLRHLVHLFPNAEFDACDLDADGVEFCATTFGAHPIHSTKDLSSVRFDDKYDLIWVGSLFTHTSYDITKKWLAVLAGLLSGKGIVVATFHGRWATRLQRHIPYIDDERWELILSDYRTKGYGYHDYSRDQTHDFISGSYGISVAMPHVIVNILEEIPGVRIYMYQEKAWESNHDVAVFGKPDWDEANW